MFGDLSILGPGCVELLVLLYLTTVKAVLRSICKTSTMALQNRALSTAENKIFCFIFTAHKQGNVSTLCVIDLGFLACIAAGGLASQHASLQGGQGSALRRECESRRSASRKDCIWGEVHPGNWTPPNTHTDIRYMGYYRIRSTSGQYASYWNVFCQLSDLFHCEVHEKQLTRCHI